MLTTAVKYVRQHNVTLALCWFCVAHARFCEPRATTVHIRDTTAPSVVLLHRCSCVCINVRLVTRRTVAEPFHCEDLLDNELLIVILKSIFTWTIRNCLNLAASKWRKSYAVIVRCQRYDYKQAYRCITCSNFHPQNCSCQF